MVSSVALIALATAFVATESAAFPQQGQQDFDRYIQSLEVGVCFRPGNDIATGFHPFLPFARSPCPLLNSLANCGHIDRYGKHIIKVELEVIIMSLLNFSVEVVQTMTSSLPPFFSLDVVNSEGVDIQHPGSLVHSDPSSGDDPMTVNPKLLDNLLGRSLDGVTLGVTEFGQARKDRFDACKATPQCFLDEKHNNIAYFEAAVAIIGFGGNMNERVTVEAAGFFLGEERFPPKYTTSATVVTLSTVNTVIAKLRAFA